LKNIEEYLEPVAILTPDGIWYEVGKQGWFGYVGKENEELWSEQVLIILQKYEDCSIVVVDCHI